MTPTASSNDRIAAFGNELIEIHIWLREELAELLDDVDGYLAGTGRRPRELGAHCLAFCSALQRHHTGEDDGAFLALAEHAPQLAPVLAELTHDHQLVSATLRRVQQLVGDLTGAAGDIDAVAVRAELGTLAALLETHFGYEERKLVAALNALDSRGATVQQMLGLPSHAERPG